MVWATALVGGAGAAARYPRTLIVEVRRACSGGGREANHGAIGMEAQPEPDIVATRVLALEIAVAVLIADAQRKNPDLFKGVQFRWREGFDAGVDGPAIADAINGHLAALVEQSRRY